LILPALVVSAAVQAGGLATYQATRPPPMWTLTIDLAGDGEGQVLVTRDGDSQPMLRCAQPRCRVDLDLGTRVELLAVPGDRATFDGWRQTPMRTPAALRPLLGDPLKGCGLDHSVDLVDDARARNALSCPVEVTADVGVEVSFGVIPEVQDVALVPSPPSPDVKLPPPAPTPIEAEKLQDKEAVALVKPVPPQVIQQLPPPPEQKQQQKDQPPPPNMTMVEVPDEHVVEKAPDDAEFLSDKNRDVAEQTRATETNLDKEQKGETKASAKSDDTTSPDVGTPDDRIAHLETSRLNSENAHDSSDHSGESDHAEGAVKGEQGDNGEGGTGAGTPGILSMRDIGGRGSILDRSGDGKKSGRKGKPGITTELTFNDYERIVGKDKADQEREIAAHRMTGKRGRWERKLQAIQSSLENFTPDVRPGNQTALKTRASPFAVYIARMHRKIHELWGFGFLEDLDNKPSSNPMNNWDLYVVLEISVNPDGTVHKTTIAKTSGILEFDVAALDTVLSAAPYEPTPEAIRSVDHRVYMRWGFYRNWRQCGTFNVEPYILTDIPGGSEPIDDGQIVKAVPKRGKQPVTPAGSMEQERPSPATTVNDEKALYAANLWVSGFATADLKKLMRFSILPFTAGGQMAAQTRGDLEDMYRGLLSESGPLRDWKLMTPSEYSARVGPIQTVGNSLVLQVRTSKETFAVVLTRMPSGEFRATQILR